MSPYSCRAQTLDGTGGTAEEFPRMRSVRPMFAAINTQVLRSAKCQNVEMCATLRNASENTSFDDAATAKTVVEQLVDHCIDSNRI